MQASRTLIFACMALAMASTPTFADPPTIRVVQVMEVKTFRPPPLEEEPQKLPQASMLAWKEGEKLPMQDCTPQALKALSDPADHRVREAFCQIEAGQTAKP